MSSVSLLCAPRKRNPFHTAWLIVSILMVNTSSCVSARAFGAQNDVWTQIVPQGHRLFPKHGYGPGMMRCESLRGLESCVSEHLIICSLVPFPHRQWQSQVVQLSEQLEAFVRVGYRRSIRCRRDRWWSQLFGAPYAPATTLAWLGSDCTRMEMGRPAGGRQSVCNFVYLLHLAPCPVWHSGWCECSEASASRPTADMNSKQH